ncbi:MAG: DUF1080 domain-containing protein [Prolixibacteraceae bacterium]|jgi:hypothetical protein|nr:DUF1080 domain-containing protein [Prolixibacteraceae bacterium]MBT6765970.1 DUF1080 domain-containing protein [Prolixibacteraceae bacterium]MBT7000892.1 DUF1080 domain-containing protein [Prolixibacteraceae bacterium]MBT7397171.1 DUF1080 domain-containing protein [Prolixibacteraceae bacterium]
MKKVRILVAIVVSVLIGISSVNAQNWTNLVDGNLDKFEKRNGTAEYKVNGDEIIGISKVGTPSTYLCTKEMYTDFILEVDVKVEVGLNSGIQFRSNSFSDYKNGQVHGYQCEIDPGERKWSGGIFDQSRRGWIYPVTMNEPGRQAFKNGEWNKYRIEAVGNEIRTWINGVQVTNLVDDMTAEGFVAFQVHSIGNSKERDGLTVRWKGPRILTENINENRWPVAAHAKEFSFLKNELTETEKRKGFRLLWDGKTTKGWRGAKMDKFPEAGWEIKDGELCTIESGGAESRGGGDIVTIEKYSNFELELDFKITEGANSGIKYFVDTELNKGAGSAIGCEFQILDDKKHPDAKNGTSANRTVGSLYDLITAHSFSEPDKKKRGANPGDWCKARVIVNGSHVEHYLNNIKVIEYDRHSQMFRALVAYSKYKKWPDFGQAADGHILLQEHGNKVDFRSVKIREL